MRIFLLLPFVFLAWSASAAKIELYPVGAFGGFRVYADCQLDGIPADCMIDTASWYTVFAATPEVKDYPSLEKVSLRGVGTNSFDCERIQPNSFLVSGDLANNLDILRCATFPANNSPLVGSALFAGKKFSFLFRQGRLEWSIPELSQTAPVGFSGDKIGHLSIEGKIGASPAKMLFDTGAPVTMATPSFIAANAACFRLSNRPPSEMMKRNKFTAYEAVCPIEVLGVSLAADFVYAADLTPITGEISYDLVLGANHLGQADWFFDLQNLRFSLNK